MTQEQRPTKHWNANWEIRKESDDGSVKWTDENGSQPDRLFAEGGYFRRSIERSKKKANGLIFRYWLDSDQVLDSGHKFVQGTDDDDDNSWGGGSVDEWLKRRYRPDQAAVAAAEMIFEEVEAKIDMETLRPTFTAAPVGGSPNVGGFLQGTPNSMYRMERAFETDAPIRMFVDLTTSCGVGADLLRGRAVAILAAARALQLIRPVELWGCSGIQPVREVGGLGTADILVATRVSVAPFDLSAASRVMCDTFYVRRILYGMARPIAGGQLSKAGIGWLQWPKTPFAELVQADPVNDVVLGGAHLSEADEIIKSPSDWVVKEIQSWVNRQKTSASVSWSE